MNIVTKINVNKKYLFDMQDDLIIEVNVSTSATTILKHIAFMSIGSMNR